MIRLIFALMTFVGLAYGNHAQINCATTNITQSYSLTAPGVVMSGIPVGLDHIQINNPSSTRICIYAEAYSLPSQAPSTPQTNEHCVPANYGFAWDFVTSNGYAFIRADGANCTSTTIDVDIW